MLGTKMQPFSGAPSDALVQISGSFSFIDSPRNKLLQGPNHPPAPGKGGSVHTCANTASQAAPQLSPQLVAPQVELAHLKSLNGDEHPSTLLLTSSSVHQLLINTLGTATLPVH
jgi:hypothetical protein